MKITLCFPRGQSGKKNKRPCFALTIKQLYWFCVGITSVLLWAFLSLTKASIYFLIIICINLIIFPASIKLPFFINTASPSIEDGHTRCMCCLMSVLWMRRRLGREWVGGMVFIAFNMVRLGKERRKKCWASTMSFYFVGSGSTDHLAISQKGFGHLTKPKPLALGGVQPLLF